MNALTAPLQPAHAYAHELLAAAENQLSGIANPEPWLIDYFGASTSSSGVRINTSTVLGLPAAWRSVDLISSKLGSMPAEVQRRQSDGAFEAIFDHPVERLLNRWCHGLYTCYTLRQTMQLHALLQGNGYAYIQRDSNGDPLSLTLIQPYQCDTVTVNGEKYHRVFFTRDQYGDVLTDEVAESLAPFGDSRTARGNGSFFFIPDAYMLHIPGMSYSGLWGLPLVSIARDAFGISKAGQDSVSYQFRNGGRPSMLLTAPRGLFPSEKQAREFMAQFRSKHEGSENTGKIGLLREGMTAESHMGENTFSGLSELTEQSRDDIALLFGTEYVMGDAAAVYKDLQSRMSAFYTNTLDKWCEIWEQECGRKLLVHQRYMTGSLRIHLDPTAILRGTPNELAEYTGSLRTQGLISGNEGREKHNLPPVEGLDDDYGNPAISTPETLDADDEESTPRPDEDFDLERDDATNLGKYAARGQKAIVRHFAKMINHERRRVEQAAEQPNGFISRIETFYVEYEEGLRALCEDLEIDPALATRHCEISKDKILEVAAVTMGPALPVCIKTLVSDWEDRHADFTDV